jgi:hypothetical protein
MSIFDVLTNVTKAAIAVTVSPVTLIADVLTLPASAENNTDPLRRTGAMLDAASDAMSEAVKPQQAGDTK